jgi:phosphotriesterase-related protein
MSTTPPVNATFVRTVRGDILPQDVGFAHSHEHTFTLPGPSARVNGEFLLDDVDKTTAELSDFYAVGGRTVVDCQPIGPERAPTLQRMAAERSGVNIVAVTGFHQAVYYEPDHFRFHETADQLAQRMIAEITTGMCEYDLKGNVRPTDIRAGALKFASDYHRIDSHAQKVAEAVAAAHEETGAPIITHTEYGTCAVEQIELFGKLGVDPSALLISHLDQNPDPYLHDEVAHTGAYLIFDGISRVKHQPDSTIVAMIRHLAEHGHVSRILLGMDMGLRSMWRSYGGGPGMDYLAKVFLVKLRKAGLGVEQIAMFTEYNPGRALSFRPR